MGYPTRRRKFYCRTCGMKFDNYDLKGRYYLHNHEKSCRSRKYNRRRNRSNYRHKGKNRITLVLVGIIVSFCILSITGTMIIGSDNYRDVESSMMFYYDLLTAVIYQDEIRKDILNFKTDKIVSYIDEIKTKKAQELEDIRIDEENRRKQEEILKKQEAIERAKFVLVKKQEMQREYESLIFTYTNNERIKLGLNPLQLNEEISNVARLHSQDMMDNNFFTHNNLRGQTPTDRGNALGISCVKDYGSYSTKGLGENIYYTVGRSVSNVVENSKYLVNGWMESKGHRENILGTSYDQIGVGVTFSGNRIYATQNFC